MTLISGAIQASAAKKAAKAQEAAAAAATAETKRQFEETRADFAPYRAAGSTALDTLLDALGIGAGGAAAGGQNALARFKASPGYEYQLGQGMRALESRAAAGGKLFSGQTGKALTEFNQGLANQEYGNWRNALFAVAGLGQSSTAETGKFGADAANNVGSYLMSAGAAKANGYVDAGRAWADAVRGLADVAKKGISGTI